MYVPEEVDQVDYTVDESGLNQTATDTKFDVGFGAFFEHDKFYAGVSLNRVTRPELDISSGEGDKYFYFNRVFYATAGYNYTLRNYPKYELKPSIFYKTDGVISQADFNCNVWYDKDYYGGLSYRIQEGFIILGGINLQTGLNLGIAGDLTTSRMRYGTWGSYEIYAAYSFDIDMNKQKSKHKSVRFL